MKPYFKYQTKLGQWTIELILLFFIFFGIFLIFVGLGERGGATFFSNLKLAIPFLIAAICGISSFLVGVASIIRNKKRSISVFLATLIGLLVLL